MSPADVDAALLLWGDRLFFPRRSARRAGAAGLPLGAGLRHKSPLAVRQNIRGVLRRSPEVVVKVSGGGRGMRAIVAHLRYISRDGALPLVDEQDLELRGSNAVLQAAEAWRLGGCPIPEVSRRREAFNIVLSMPPDTDPEAVWQAAAAFARREFRLHAYVLALHRPDEDERTDRPHVHLCVRAEDGRGRRLNPRKLDLAQWRSHYAEELRERGVDAVATRRQARESSRAWVRQDKFHRRRREGSRSASALPEVHSHVNTEVRRNWGELARALAQSPAPEDRQLAMDIDRHLRVRTCEFETSLRPNSTAPSAGRILRHRGSVRDIER
jgi:relaxase-like protein